MEELKKFIDEFGGDPEFVLTNELDFLSSVWRCSEVPLRTRITAAVECAKFKYPRMAVTAQVSRNDFATLVEKARERAASVFASSRNVIPLRVAPDRPTALSSPAELESDASHSDSAPFRRRF
jgi:hypothetical protein